MPTPGPHDMLPATTHDESARRNFIFSFKEHVQTSVLPGNKIVYDARVEPTFRKEHGRRPRNRHEVRAQMRREPYWQMFGSLSHLVQEIRQDINESIAFRQTDELTEKAKRYRKGAKFSTLRLDPDLRIPRYLTAVDNHAMPGSYYSERTEDDVTAGAMYDPGVYFFSMGSMGDYNEDMGVAVIQWLQKERPDFRPRRILDMGCSVGHSTTPYLVAFPDAEVHAIDVGAPMLRYAQARAESMGSPIHFSQQNAEHTDFPDGHFDLVVSHILLHETSGTALRNIMRESHRLLKEGGLVIHAEVPTRNHELEPFTEFMRDWSTHYNAEPYWGALHDTDLADVAVKAGFDERDVIEVKMPMSKPGVALPYATWLLYGASKTR